jgi:ribosomal protein S27E
MAKQMPIPCPICMGETKYKRPTRTIEITCQHCKTILIITPTGKHNWYVEVKSDK